MKILEDGIKLLDPFSTEAKNGNQVWHLKYWNEPTQEWLIVTKTISKGKHTKKCPAEVYNYLEKRVREKIYKYSEFKTNVSVSEAFKEWLSKRKLEVESGLISEGTHEGDVIYTKDFLSEFGHWNLKSIKTIHLKKYFDEFVVFKGLSRERKPSVNSLRNIRSKILLFFEYCWLEKSYISSSPMSELRIKKHKKTQSEYDKLKDKCFFSEQMEVLLNYMKEFEKTQNAKQEDCVRKRLFIEFTYLNGNRYGEGAGLKFSTVNHGGIWIKDQYSRKSSVKNPINKQTKTVTSRRIKAFENDDTRSKEIIQWFLDHNNSGINDDYIFVRKNGHLLSDDTMNRYLHRFENQMPDKLSSSFVMHSLRHSYITRRAEAGDTETEIMAKVGHANPNLVHTLYTHVRDTLKFDEQKKFKKQPRLLKIGKSA